MDREEIPLAKVQLAGKSRAQWRPGRGPLPSGVLGAAGGAGLGLRVGREAVT
jgi:hypothetical protein